MKVLERWNAQPQGTQIICWVCQERSVRTVLNITFAKHLLTLGKCSICLCHQICLYEPAAMAPGISLLFIGFCSFKNISEVQSDYQEMTRCYSKRKCTRSMTSRARTAAFLQFVITWQPQSTVERKSVSVAWHWAKYHKVYTIRKGITPDDHMKRLTQARGKSLT